MMQHDPSVPTAYAVHSGSPSHPPPSSSSHPSVLVNSYHQQPIQPSAPPTNNAYQTQLQNHSMAYASQTSPHHPQMQQHHMSLIQHQQSSGISNAGSAAAPASRALFNPSTPGVPTVMQTNINPNDPNAQTSYVLHPAYQQMQQVPSSHAEMMRSHDEQQRQLQYQQQQQQSQHEQQMLYHQQQMMQAQQQQQQQQQHQQQLAMARQAQSSPHMQLVPTSQPQVILPLPPTQPNPPPAQQILYQQATPIAVPPQLHIIPTSVHAPSLSILTPLASPRSSLPQLLTKRNSVGASSPKFQTRPEELYQPPQCYSPLTATTPKSMSFPGLYQSALSKASAQLLSCVSTPSTPTSTSMTTVANLYSKERYGMMYRPIDHALMHDPHILRHAHPTYEYVPVHVEPVPAAATIPEEDEAMPQSSPVSTGFMSDLLAATNSTKKKAAAQAPAVKTQPAVQPPIAKEKLKRKPEAAAEPVVVEEAPQQPAAKKKKVKAAAPEAKPRVNTAASTTAIAAPSPSKAKPAEAALVPPSPSNASVSAPSEPAASTTPVLAPSIPSPSLMASPATKERQSRNSRTAISTEVLEELAASIAQAKKKDRKSAHGPSSTPSTPLAAPAPAPVSMTDSADTTALPPVKEEPSQREAENGAAANDAKLKTEDDAMDTNTENGADTVTAAKTEPSTASAETAADVVMNTESGDKSEQPHLNGNASKKASSSKKKKAQPAAVTTASSDTATEEQAAPSGNSSAIAEEKESMTDEERRLAELKRAEELNEKYISKYLTLYDQSAAFANRDGRTRHQVTANASPAEALLKKKGAKREREFNPKSVIQQIKQDMKAIVQKSKQSSSSANNSEAGAVGTHSSASSVAANDAATNASEVKAPASSTDTAADDVASTAAGESLAPSTSSPPLTGRKRGRPPRKPQVVAVATSNEVIENHKEVSSQPSTPALTAKPSTKPVSPVEEKGSKGESENDEDSEDDDSDDSDDDDSSSEEEEEEPKPRKRLSELDRLHLANQSVFHAEEKERKKRLKAEKKKAAAAAAAAAAGASASVLTAGATTPTSSSKKR